MANKIKSANKLVTKATTSFSDAVAQVEKANELLRDSIMSDIDSNDKDRLQLAILEEKIESRNSGIDSKLEQIESNDALIKQFKSFVPQQ